MPCKRGVTLIEMVVSIGIVTILLSLTFTAIQSIRESARRTQCQHNLRQNIMATQAFHTAEQALPSLYNGTSLTYPLREWDLFHMHSWRVPLLPYLEQSALRQEIAWDALATEEENEKIAQTELSVFICPSSGPPSKMGWGLRHEGLLIPADEVPEASRYYVVRSDYDAMAGIQVLPDPFPTGMNSHATKFMRWGVWGWAVFDTDTISGSKLQRYRQGRFRDITDGLSNTIAIVERGGKPIDMLNGKPNVTEENPNADYPGQVGWSASNTFIWAVNGNGVGVNESNSNGIYSLHTGGANIATADGAVQFLSDGTDFPTLVRLFGRANGG